MAATTFRVRALRRVGVSGQALEPGDEASIDSPQDAVFLSAIGAVELLDDADAVADAARREHARRQRQGRPPKLWAVP